MSAPRVTYDAAYFTARSEATAEGCWLWRRSYRRDGYGQVMVTTAGGHKENRAAHRLAYEALVGAIPNGAHLHHRCETRACVNPAHLHPVEQAQHNRVHAASRVTCRRGHEWTEASTYARPGGTRECRVCIAVVRERRAA